MPAIRLHTFSKMCYLKHTTVHALKGGKSGWPVLLGKLPSLPPLQCTTHFTLHCYMLITINCTLYIRIYFTLYRKLTEYCKIYYPVRFNQQLEHL